MIAQKTLEAAREHVAVAIEAAADVIEMIEAPPARTAAARKRLAGTLRRIADGLDRMDASPLPTIH